MSFLGNPSSTAFHISPYQTSFFPETTSGKLIPKICRHPYTILTNLLAPSDTPSHEDDTQRPSRRSRFRSAVSTFVSGLSPVHVTSFSRIEIRTALAALINPDHAHTARSAECTPVNTLDDGNMEPIPYIVPPMETPSPSRHHSSIRSSSRSSFSSLGPARPPSVQSFRPLRLPNPPALLPRFTFEASRYNRPATTTDPEVLHQQIQALLRNNNSGSCPPPRALKRIPSTPRSSRNTAVSLPPPYASRPTTPLGKRDSLAPSPIGPDGKVVPLPTLPTRPQRSASRLKVPNRI